MARSLDADRVVPVLVVVAVLGLVIGSFVNVVVWRVPRGLSIVSPPSACPRCNRPIRAWENIPVFSWLALRGRCRGCRQPISLRYPAVELGTSVLFVLLAIRTGISLSTPPYLYLAAIGVALALIDLDVRRLPNSIVLPAYPVGVALLAVASWGRGDWPALIRAGIGAGVLFALYFAMMAGSAVLIGSTGMGFGDVKLAGVLGLFLAWLGWGELVVGAFSGFLLGGIFSIGLLASGRANRKTGVPFGPWMLSGALVGVAWGGSLWASYLGLLG